MSVRVARSRELAASGFAVAAVACVRQTRGVCEADQHSFAARFTARGAPVDQAIVEEAITNQTDGYMYRTASS